MWRFLVLAVLAYGAMLGCTNPSVDLPACAFRLFDADNNGEITLEEIDTRLASPMEGVLHPEMFNTTVMLEACDTNNDTVFTQADWDADPCVTDHNTQVVLCALCHRNQ